MAILTKRSSKASLPGATPQAVTRPSDKMKAVQKTAQRPSAVLTSALKPNTSATTTGSSTAKPSINAGTPSSLTTRVSGTTRPAITRNASAASSSGMGNTLKNALVGAGVGMAGKMAYDKIFGGNTATGGKGTTGSAAVDKVINTAKGAVTSKVVDNAVNAIKGVVNPKAPGTTTKPTVPVTPKPPTRPAGPTTPTKPTKPTGPTAPVRPTPPAGGGATRPDEGSTDTGTDAYGGKVNEDGSVTYTYDDGSTITMDADGNVLSSSDAVDTGVDEEYVGGGEDQFGGTTNDDGSVTYTYDDGSTITLDADGNIMSSTDAPEYGSGDELGSSDDAYGYYEDEYGNIYDGNGDLVYSSEGNYTDEYSDTEDHSDYVYTDEYGYQYDWDGNVIYDPYEMGGDSEYGYDDSEITFPDDWYTEDENAYTEPEYYEDLDDWYGKKGGLVALMANGGGVRRFYDGGYSDTGEEVQDWQNVDYNFGEFDEPTMTGYTLTGNRNPVGNTYSSQVDSGVRPFGYGAPDTSLLSNPYQTESEVVDTEMFDDGSYIEYLSDGSSVTYDSDGNVYQTAQGSSGGNQTVTYDDGSTITYDADGNVVSYTNAPDDSGNQTYTYDDGSTITYDSQGNVVGTTEATDTAITGAGGTGGAGYRKPNSPAQTAQQRLQQQNEKGALASLSNWFKENPTLGAGAAGALVGTLLSDNNLFGGSNEPAPSIDMTKAGVINPRTTDFGIGAPRFVTYNEYSARDQMPDLYGDELYRNLNAPGFNPVREGDYGYEAPAEEPATPQMADGGSVDTYFTFGKPVDPLRNLTNPQPAQQQPQAGGLGGMMPQMPKPQMPVQPQMGQQPQQMKRGGLPAVSDVPLAEGRLDFRQGSAVHGPGDGQSDDIPAMLADGEYVIDAETVAQIGNGSTKAGAQALDKFRENIRRHKRSAPVNKIPPKTKALTSYLKKGK